MSTPPMERPELLKREIKALAFDQYGTVVDMQKGLTEAVTPFHRNKGWQGSLNSFVTWWRRTHFQDAIAKPPATGEHQESLLKTSPPARATATDRSRTRRA